MNRKILVAYDGSLLSEKAIQQAKEQAALIPGTMVHIITVIEETGPSTSVHLARNITNEIEDHSQQQMDKIASSFEKDGVPVNTEIIVSGPGNPGRKICAYAKEREIDMIIVGSRGLGNVRSLFLGSVSNEIVHHANCQVLIVK